MDLFFIVFAIFLLGLSCLLSFLVAYKNIVRTKNNYASGRRQNGDICLDDICSGSDYLKLTNIE